MHIKSNRNSYIIAGRNHHLKTNDIVVADYIRGVIIGDDEARLAASDLLNGHEPFRKLANKIEREDFVIMPDADASKLSVPALNLIAYDRAAKMALAAAASPGTRVVSKLGGEYSLTKGDMEFVATIRGYIRGGQVVPDAAAPPPTSHVGKVAVASAPPPPPMNLGNGYADGGFVARVAPKKSIYSGVDAWGAPITVLEFLQLLNLEARDYAVVRADSFVAALKEEKAPDAGAGRTR